MKNLCFVSCALSSTDWIIASASRSPLWILGVILTAGGICSSSRAATIVEDNFDSYADQAAFVSVWPLQGGTTTPSGTLSGVQSVSAPNAINYATTAQRNERAFSESGIPTSADLNNVIRFSFDFYDSNAAINPYRQFANLQDGTAPSSGGQLVSMGLNNNLLSTAEGGNFYMARILGFNGNAYFKLNDNAVLLRSTGWHNLAVEISDVDFKFYVDGQLAETVLQGGLTLRSYDLVRLGSGLSSISEAYFDNVKVETVPEPSAAVLGLAGLVGVIRRRR